jgi:taurine dioxygenase
VRNKPLTDVLGVEVEEVDLREPLTAQTASELRRLFVERSLLLFRDQTLSEDDQRRLVTALGPLSKRLLPPAEDTLGPPAFYLSNDYADGRGELRPHSDHCFLDEPLWGISLYAHATPTRGGETIYSSAVAACRHLPAPLRQSLDGRVAMHRYQPRERLGEDIRDPTLSDELSAAHPVIWEHPVSGAPVLYVNPWMTRHIVGLEPEESRTLLAALTACVTDPAVSYHHIWHRGDFVVWDNIALLHARTAYDATERRLLHRLQLGLPDSARQATVTREPLAHPGGGRHGAH